MHHAAVPQPDLSSSDITDDIIAVRNLFFERQHFIRAFEGKLGLIDAFSPEHIREVEEAIAATLWEHRYDIADAARPRDMANMLILLRMVRVARCIEGRKAREAGPPALIVQAITTSSTAM